MWKTSLPFLLALAACPREPEPTFEGPWRWDESPVPVAIHAEVGYEREFRMAIDTWNNAAGCQVLFQAPQAPVNVMLGNDTGVTKGFTKVYAIGNYITRADITMHGVAESGMAYRVLAHELGRSLGLRGSGWPEPESSVMHINIAERTRFPVLVTYADGRAVGESYCQ